MGKKTWTQEEIDIVEEGYKNNVKIQDLADKLHKTCTAISSLAVRKGFSKKYIKPNNARFKAVYQDYDWCYDRFINKGMTQQEMADEANASIRVIKKWCTEKYGLHNRSFKEFKKLNDLQYQIILFGTLGDGHIDKREDEPLYIESHSIEEKDYLFWKYEILKDLCGQPPVYHEEKYSNFGGNNYYLCKPTYRMGTRVINDLKRIRNMSRSDKISQLNEFGFCLHILDDGNRGDLWTNCLAEWSDEEVELYIRICKERFGLNCKRQTDVRYVQFDAYSSTKIDSMILKNIPNDIDIVHKKILDNNKIRKFQQCIYIMLPDDKEVGFSTYCKKNHMTDDYEELRNLLRERELYRLTEAELLKIYEDEVLNHVKVRKLS